MGDIPHCKGGIIIQIVAEVIENDVEGIVEGRYCVPIDLDIIGCHRRVVVKVRTDVVAIEVDAVAVGSRNVVIVDERIAELDDGLALVKVIGLQIVAQLIIVEIDAVGPVGKDIVVGYNIIAEVRLGIVVDVVACRVRAGVNTVI